MNKNTKSNQERIWTVLVAIAPFLLLCASPKVHPKTLVPLSFPSFFLVTRSFSPLPPESFFFCICVSLPRTQSVEGNPLSFLPFPFLLKIIMLFPFYVGPPLSICMQPH